MYREKKSQSQLQKYEDLFGSLNGPMHRAPNYKEPLDMIQSEYESIQTEIDNQIEKAQNEMESAKVKYKDQQEKLDEETIKIYEELRTKRRSLKDKINSSKNRRLFDKITFFISLMVVQYKSFALGKYPDSGVYWLNLILLVLLFLWRNISYRIEHIHYYMFEFCYYGNIIMYIFIFLFPENKYLYYASFAFCMGPLGWALALVGCSFVLHNIDQLTSCFIHFTPMVLMFNLHWNTQYNENRGWALYNAKEDTFSFTWLKEYYLSAVSIYLIWAISYYLMVFVLLKQRIKQRNYDTLVAFHITKETAVGKFLKSYGPAYEGVIYIVSHFLIIQIIFLFTIICYFSFYASLLVVMLTSSVSFWNGATFYMDYFSKKYEINLKKLDDLHDNMSEGIINNKKKN